MKETEQKEFNIQNMSNELTWTEQYELAVKFSFMPLTRVVYEFCQIET